MPLEVQQTYPEIEWARIIGLRNRLAHDYREVLAQRVWKIAVYHVPELLRQLLSIEEVTAALSE